MKHKLSSKIIAILGLTIFSIIAFYTIIFSTQYEKYEQKIVGEENIKTLRSLATSMETIIKNADDYSKMLLSDSVIQAQMESGDLVSSISGQSEVIRKIYSIFQFSDYVEAIWLIDKNGQKLTVGGSTDIELENNFFEYAELKKNYGEYELFVSHTSKGERVSLVRSYNSLENFKSLGLIGVDIESDFLSSLIYEIINIEEEQLVILNEKNEVIIQCGNLTNKEEMEAASKKISIDNREILENIRINNREYLLVGTLNENSGWKIIRYAVAPKNQDIQQIVEFNILLISIIGGLILFSAAIISTMLTNPIQTLMNSMKGVENKNFSRIDKKPLLDEFQILFRGYNQMVEQIERLIQSEIEKQKRIRHVELNEIQEQMKPHFLYNTLDSIQALAMMGESEKVCELVEALGGFYRKSVSGGREMLTLYEEFQMAKDYVDIMKIRFENSFEFEVSIEDSCKNYLIPKLTIQPLVENSFQHGIRVKEQYGKIILLAYKKEDTLVIKISDNGDGVPNDVVEELMENNTPRLGKSLGLRGTIERLRLIYEDDFEFEIRNQGVAEICLYIRIDRLEERENGR